MQVAGSAEQILRNGDPAGALDCLQAEVRSAPADPRLRVFLFQLLCVLGQWERALNQLKVAAGLDPGVLAMAQTYGDAVRCEAIRAEVFDGQFPAISTVGLNALVSPDYLIEIEAIAVLD